MYNVQFSSKSTKFLRKLPKNTLEKIKKRFFEISKEPFRYLEHFEGSGYKFRIGIFRALIDVDTSRKILFVRVFDKRSRVYRK